MALTMVSEMDVLKGGVEVVGMVFLRVSRSAYWLALSTVVDLVSRMV